LLCAGAAADDLEMENQRPKASSWRPWEIAVWLYTGGVAFVLLMLIAANA
jgi:hypothetical protein